MSKRTVINLIFFLFVFFAMCIWAVNNIVTIDAVEQPYTVTGDFAAASGVQPNAEVAYLGVHYGQVSSVVRDPGGVKITMKIDKNRKDIPKASTARIFRKSAVGEPYIDFKPDDGFDPQKAQPSDFLKNGDNVPRERTSNPLEFSELLRSAAALLHNIDADKAGTLIHELALALNGRGDDLRSLTQSMDQLSTTFAAKTDTLDRLATNNTAITHVVATHANDFGQSLTNLSLIADSLKNANGNTAILLDEGSQLMGQLADLVAAEKGNLDCTLHDLGDVIDMSSQPQRIAGTDFLLGNAATAFGNVWNTRDELGDGVWVRTNLLAEANNPSPQYVPPHELPTPPAVPQCASPLASTSHGPDFVPARALASSTRTTTTLPMPKTGGGALIDGVTVVAALLSAAAAFRWVINVARQRS
jgi:phospholipid/cholesterol/gamma-HCH transport system substrate-binding protein